MSLGSVIKGWFGETMGAAAHLLLDRDTYIRLNNVTIPAQGGTTQIDHVILSRYGIFVVEAKNIDGWIFGDPTASQWTVSKFGKKNRIQNPLRQNYRHTKALAELLNIEHEKLISVVMFWGECEFKTPMPPNVLAKGYISYIKSFTKVLFKDEEILGMVRTLTSGMLPQTWATRRQHLESLNARHSSTTTCAKCGQPLVIRVGRTGANAGQRFYGCSTYPRCRFTASCRNDD